jgi:hypothetical protein
VHGDVSRSQINIYHVRAVALCAGITASNAQIARERVQHCCRMSLPLQVRARVCVCVCVCVCQYDV